MADSKQIAGLAGPTLVVVTLSETLNFHIWAENIAPLIFLNGALLFVAGLSIVRAHNRWTYGWPVAVTLTGWIGILGGLLRMFAPDVQQGASGTVKLAITAMVFVLGSFLTFKAYSGGRRQESRPGALSV